MTFKEASAFRMPFGKYYGMKLGEIGVSDEGLQYLDWLRGEHEGKPQTALDHAIATYLDDPTIRRDLEGLK